MRIHRLLLVCGGLGLVLVGCQGDKCKTDEDCKSSGKDSHKVCYEGRCITLKGESGRAGRPPGRREVDPKVTFRVPVDPKKNPTLGLAHAPVTVVEFSDFQCPFCGKAANTMKDLVNAFPKAVRLVFMHNPLHFHKDAQLAAEASQAVFALKGADAFWKYHDVLFANKRDLKRPNLEKWAGELGVDLKKFKAALDKGTHRKLVKDQQRLVTRLGASGAPAFFINGRFVSGARPLDFFKGKVNEALKRAQTLKSPKGIKPKDVYNHIIKSGKTKAVYK